MAATPVVSSTSSTPTIKRSHSEMASDESHADIPASSKRFASPLVDVYVGEHKFHYTIHTAFLAQSGELNNLHNLTSKRSKKGTTLNLPRENPREVGQVIQFLYLNDLALTATEPQAQLDELLSAWKNATQFAVADMKRHVLQKLDTLSLAEKVHALNFIKATDQMYEYDIDVDLRIYFNKVAPSVVRKIRASERRCLDDMIEEGGSFAADLFSAYRRAFDISADVKGEGPARSAKGVGGDASGIMLIPMPARSGPVDNRTQWDRQHRIPALWTRVSEADKLLVSMVKADEGWIAILDAVQQKTREKSTITDLLERYNRLKANILRVESDDSDLLAEAQSEVETEFKEGSEWPLVAARLIEKGGRGYEPIRLRYHCAALDAVKQAKSAPTSTDLVLATPQSAQTKTEVIGGVRVDNSKAIDPRRRPKPGTAASARYSSDTVAVRRLAQARKRSRSTRESGTLQDVSSNEDDNLMLAESKPRLYRTRGAMIPVTGRRRKIENGNGNGNESGSDGGAPTAHMSSSNTPQDSSMADVDRKSSSHAEPVAVSDSDAEEL
ncbi:hypothetical protein XANCAGTX0491_004718 [Xanthoria calcicola]